MVCGRLGCSVWSTKPSTWSTSEISSRPPRRQLSAGRLAPRRSHRDRRTTRGSPGINSRSVSRSATSTGRPLTWTLGSRDLAEAIGVPERPGRAALEHHPRRLQHRQPPSPRRRPRSSRLGDPWCLTGRLRSGPSRPRHPRRHHRRGLPRRTPGPIRSRRSPLRLPRHRRSGRCEPGPLDGQPLDTASTPWASTVA